MHQTSRMPARPAALLSLLLAGVGCALVYCVALLRFPLLAIYARPLQNLDKLTLSAPATGAVMAGCIVLLFVGYGLGAVVVWRSAGRSQLAPLVVVGAPLLFVAILFLVYPTTSLDIYDYLFRGRMLARYGANTFVQVPQDFAADPLMSSKPVRFIPWSRAVTAYGPLWEAASWAVARLAGEAPGPAPSSVDPSLLRLMLAYKLLGALGFLLCGAAIWGALGAARPAQRWLGLYLWLWNPLALWESVAAGHNDAWMAALIVLAVWVFQGSEASGQGSGEARFHSIGAFLALTIGGLVKYLALFFGPLLLAAALRRISSWQGRLQLVLVGGAVCAGLVGLAYAPFWEGPSTLRNFVDRGALFYASGLALVQALLVEGGVTKEVAQRLVSSLGYGLLLAGVGWSAWRGWRAPAQVAGTALGLLLWFLVVCNTWFQPWYLLWALALVAIQPWRTRVVAGMALFCCTAMLSHVAGSFLLPALGWNGEGAAWNGLLSALIYGPPLLAFGWSGRARLAALLPRATSKQHNRDTVTS